MANAVISAASMFMDKVVITPYLWAKTAILADPSKFQYSLFGKTTYVREVVGGVAGSYRPSAGFRGFTSGGSVVWTQFTAPHDRMLHDRIDALDELNSILQGMQLSGVAMNSATWKNFSAELDATTIATLYNSAPASNVFENTVAGYEITPDKIFHTLNKIKLNIFDAGYEDAVAVFVDTTTFANIQTAIIDKYGLANSSVLKMVVGEKEGLDVNINVLMLDNLLIIRVPKVRMVSNVVLYDGVTAGQESGGWVKDVNAKNINILAVPLEAAALSIRHVVANLAVPALFTNVNVSQINSALMDIYKIYGNAIEIQNIGINQSADQFAYMNRIIYGAIVFETWKKTIFAVTEPLA